MKSLILSDTCVPLEPIGNDHEYSWLLEGNEKEVRRVWPDVTPSSYICIDKPWTNADIATTESSLGHRRRKQS